MNRELVVNADDFGWSRSVNSGIVESHVTGIVTRASILATGSAFEHAIGLAIANPTLGIGVHLNLYRGRTILPREQVSTIVTGPDGMLLGDWRAIVWRLTTSRIDLSQVEAEFRAQIQRVRSAGVHPMHLDSDKHLHIWPSLFDVVCRLALEFEIPNVRVVREPPAMSAVSVGLGVLSMRDARAAEAAGLTVPSGTIGVASAPTDVDSLDRLLHRARGRRVELIVHPGRVDEEFMHMQSSLPNRLVRSREAELRVLAAPAARDAVSQAGFTLAGAIGDVPT